MERPQLRDRPCVDCENLKKPEIAHGLELVKTCNRSTDSQARVRLPAYLPYIVRLDLKGLLRRDSFMRDW